MKFTRPAPEIVAARKWEIKRRYERKSKVTKRGRSMASIRLAELTRWLDDKHGRGAELEPSEQSINIARIFAHHMAALPDMPRRVGTWLDRYAPWIDIAGRERLISECASCPLKWSADKLAWKLRLSDADRARLRIKTIGAFDFSKEQRKERDRIRRAEREKARRAAKRALHID